MHNPPTTPLDLTIDDMIETRADYPTTTHMRWPADPETTRRLEAVGKLVLVDRPLPWWRRLIRLLTRAS